MEKKVKEEQISENEIAGVLERNIKTLVVRQVEEEKKKPIEERIADSISHFVGNMAFVYTHIVIFGVWIILNLEWFNIKPFDPNFIALSLITQLEAIFLTTFVLMSQNSLDAQADKRAELGLQMGLLSEHEVTRLIKLVTAVAKKLDVEEANDPEMKELSKDIMPEQVMDSMESYKQKNGE